VRTLRFTTDTPEEELEEPTPQDSRPRDGRVMGVGESTGDSWDAENAQLRRNGPYDYTASRHAGRKRRTTMKQDRMFNPPRKLRLPVCSTGGGAVEYRRRRPVFAELNWRPSCRRIGGRHEFAETWREMGKLSGFVRSSASNWRTASPATWVLIRSMRTFIHPRRGLEHRYRRPCVSLRRGRPRSLAPS